MTEAKKYWKSFSDSYTLEKDKLILKKNEDYKFINYPQFEFHKFIVETSTKGNLPGNILVSNDQEINFNNDDAFIYNFNITETTDGIKKNIIDNKYKNLISRSSELYINPSYFKNNTSNKNVYLFTNEEQVVFADNIGWIEGVCNITGCLVKEESVWWYIKGEEDVNKQKAKYFNDIKPSYAIKKDVEEKVPFSKLGIQFGVLKPSKLNVEGDINIEPLYKSFYAPGQINKFDDFKTKEPTFTEEDKEKKFNNSINRQIWDSIGSNKEIEETYYEEIAPFQRYDFESNKKVKIIPTESVCKESQLTALRRSEENLDKPYDNYKNFIEILSEQTEGSGIKEMYKLETVKKLNEEGEFQYPKFLANHIMQPSKSGLENVFSVLPGMYNSTTKLRDDEDWENIAKCLLKLKGPEQHDSIEDYVDHLIKFFKGTESPKVNNGPPIIDLLSEDIQLYICEQISIFIKGEREQLDTIFRDTRKDSEALKDFVTLAFESWYINQNISGILKKCAENSGVPYEDIVGKGTSKEPSDPITPSQYIYEKHEKIAEWNNMVPLNDSESNRDKLEAHLKTMLLQSEGEIDNKFYDVSRKVCKDKNSFYQIYKNIEKFVDRMSGLEDGKDIRTGLDVKTSTEGETYFINVSKQLKENEKIRVFPIGASYGELDVEGEQMIEQLNQDIYNQIREDYIPEAIYPIKRFPETINEQNELNFTKGLNEIKSIYAEGKDDDWWENSENTKERRAITKVYQKRDINSIIGVLLSPYMNGIALNTDGTGGGILQDYWSGNDTLSYFKDVNDYWSQTGGDDPPHIDEIYDVDKVITQGSKDTLNPTEDLKLFYVFQNNNTQLKCWQQLKTFQQFSKFVRVLNKD